MKRKLSVVLLVTVLFVQLISAQTIYVDAKKGLNTNSGLIDEPYKTIEKAVQEANSLTGQGNIKIKLKPGLYVLEDKVSINPLRTFQGKKRFIIEAYIMPDDSVWNPMKMPVIQSVSGNNSDTQFPHSAGLYIASDNVHIRGVKFIGNANPNVFYYYPINQVNPELKGLTISQCYFIGDRNSTNIQGGVWAIGQDVSISHCIFKECRNAILIFKNEGTSSITNNIITDAFESAFWMQVNGDKFNFRNNVISNCNYVWTEIGTESKNYTLANCVISENSHFLGKWNNKKYILEESAENLFTETNIVKDGAIKQVIRSKEIIPKKHLHLSPESPGYELKAGIYKQ